jgi:hypothetical protein
MRLGVAIPLLVLNAFPIALIAQAKVYRNRDFGIVVPIPHGLYLLGPHKMTGIDHGPQLFFKPTSVEDCAKGACDRYISVFAGCNCVVDTAKLHDFLEQQCASIANGPCLPAPEDLNVNVLRSEAARVNHADGTVEIIVVTQAGKPDPGFDSSVPSVNYAISLWTSEQHMNEDLRTFRIILKTIRISPPS